MKQRANQEGWKCFLTLCSTLKTSKEFNEFFNLILSIEERNDIADRFLIIRDLLHGQSTQRDMADALQVSIAKITRGSNSLKTIDEKFRDFLIKNIKSSAGNLKSRKSNV